MFSNGIYGIQAMGLYLKTLLLSFFAHPVVLGFLIGFLASTAIHMIIVSQSGRQLRSAIVHKPHESYTHLHSPEKDGTYRVSYSQFLKDYYHLRIAFYSAVTVFLSLTLVVLMRF